MEWLEIDKFISSIRAWILTFMFYEVQVGPGNISVVMNWMTLSDMRQDMLLSDVERQVR